MQNFRDRPPLNLSQLHQTMQTIELACNSIQMHITPKAAEAAISDLYQSSHVYQACQFILDNSQVANAKFHAADVIRHAALKEWGFLDAADRIYLIKFCLCFVMQHASAPYGYVQTKVSSTAAQLIKRGWLEFTPVQKEAFFNLIEQAIFGIHEVDVRYCGIIFLENLISEFSLSTLTAMGVPGEYHENCRMSLELEYLKTFYSWAQRASQGVANIIVVSESDTPEVKVCAASFRLMHQILNWDFKYKRSAVGIAQVHLNALSEADSHVRDSFARTECVLVQLGPSWRDVLLLSNHIEWTLSFYAAVRQKFYLQRSWLDSPIAVCARKLIVQLCSLTGDIFPSDSREMQEHHLGRLLSGIIHWIDPPDDVCSAVRDGKSESELLDGCRALFSIANVTSPSVFNQILKPIRPFGTFCLLATLMGEVIKDIIMDGYIDDESWSWAARDILLDTWENVLVSIPGSDAQACLSSEGVDALACLFTLIVEAELKFATVSNEGVNFAFVRASVSAMDQRLGGYALIGRAVIETSIPLITQMFSERFARLSQGREMWDSVEILEELYHLLLLTGHVLADEGVGETPIVPETIQTAFRDAQHSDNHPVLLLSRSILGFTEQFLSLLMGVSVFSPRLMEAVVWFLGRWSSTYLLQSNEESNQLKSDSWGYIGPAQSNVLNFYGENDNGKFVLDIIVRIAMVSLLSFPRENGLQELVCRHLLPAIVRRRVVCRHLITLESWQNLARAFVHERAMIQLHPTLQRLLAKLVVLPASAMKDSESSCQFIRDFTCHITTSLTEMSSKKDLNDVAQHPNTILLITCFFERLRGVSNASEARTQKAIFEMGFSILDSVLIFLEVYKHEMAVVYVVLKFVVHWVGNQTGYLDAHQTAVVVGFCMRLLQMYATQNIGKISASSSSRLLGEVKAVEYKDLRAILQLITKLCSKEVVDFSPISLEDFRSIKISEVLYFGLHLISPLISAEMLKFPKLCHAYFSLLCHLLEVYPEMFSQLNDETVSHVTWNIDYGIHHQDVDIADMCLRALSALASYHYKQTVAGKGGLGTRATSLQDVNGNMQDGFLSRNLNSLLYILLFQDYSTEIISSAADALLPLILCNQSLYQKLGTELIERQSSETLRSRVTNALHLLTTSNQLSSNLDRSNYQKFRKNLSAFLLEVRGFLRTM